LQDVANRRENEQIIVVPGARNSTR
jgi:hypothetical protein